MSYGLEDALPGGQGDCFLDVFGLMRSWLPAERGACGLQLLRRLCRGARGALERHLANEWAMLGSELHPQMQIEVWRPHQ